MREPQRRLTQIKFLRIILVWSFSLFVGSEFWDLYHKQPPNPVVSEVRNPVAPRDTVNEELMNLTKRSLYSLVIQKTDNLLKAKKDDYLLYWLGFSEWKLGLFEAAKNHLKNLNNLSPGQNFPPVAQCISSIDTELQLRPLHMKEIRENNSVLFKIYFEENNAWEQNVEHILPQAYAANKEIFGVDIYGTPVYIFSNYAHFKQFLLAYGGSVTSWQTATGCEFGLCLSQFGPNGDLQQNTSSSPNLIASRTAHELNHCIVKRHFNAGLPSWILEGVADFAGSKVAPEDTIEVEKYVTEMRSKDTIRPLDKLINNFYDEKDAFYMYEQASDMMNYLFSFSKPKDFVNYLEAVRDTGDSDQAFQRTYKLTIPQFYTAWLQNTKK